jgi:mannitol/fructose-specific phosphotransferase system IIA component (Ntr-type)
MNLAKFFDPDLISVDLKASSKKEAVEALTANFCKKYPDKDHNIIINAIIEREEHGSTSFGRGFAFPHARTDAVSDLYIVVGIVKDGINDDSPDNIPLKVICLLLTPRNISRLYLQTLSGLAGLARRTGMVEQLTSVKNPTEFLRVIENSNIRVRRALSVKDIIEEQTPKVEPGDSLKKVANIIFKYRLTGIPVVDNNGELVGEISDKELLKSALPDYESFIANLANLPELEPFEDLLRQEDKIFVNDVMNKDVATVSPDAQVVEVAALMLFKDIERVMVVDDKKFIGMISRTDLVSKFIRG